MTSIKAFKLIKQAFSIKSHLFNNKLLLNRKLLNNSRTIYRFSSDLKNKTESQSIELIDEQNFEDLTIEKYNELIKSEEMREKIELILSEYEYEKYTTYKVPTTLTIDNMKDLLICESNERKLMLKFWHRNQFLNIKDKNKKLLKSEEISAKNREKYSKLNSSRTGIFDNNGKVVYGLWHNTIFTRVSRSSVIRLTANKLKIAALFGQKIVIDLDFDKYMKLRECRLLAKQLGLLYNYNKYITNEAFDLHFTNCHKDMPTMKAVPNHIQSYGLSSVYSQFHEKSYLDLFPKEKLVYLTPNARKPLLNYNHDSIYIIGGMIDKSFHEPVTYVKARNEGIQTYRLPIDEFILWGKGCKYLCLNHILAILHDVKHNDNNWEQSLKTNIPDRKQKKTEEILYEDALREQKYKRDVLKNRIK